MQTPQVLGSAPLVRPSRRYVSVGLVAALHVVVIYGLLVGINVVPNPLQPPGPIDAFVIPKAAPHPPLPRPPDGPLVTPRVPMPAPNPTPPTIDYGATPQGPTIYQGPSTGFGNPPLGVALAARGITATHTIPPYPPMGVRLGHEGTVRVVIALDEAGNVISAQVETSSGYQELDAAAVAWVKSHWRYQPAMRDGQPVPATTRAAVTFRLNQIRG
jgi:protein TonB